MEFINKSGGVKGLLCVADERDSYDLSPSENRVLQQNKFYQKR